MDQLDTDDVVRGCTAIAALALFTKSKTELKLTKQILMHAKLDRTIFNYPFIGQQFIVRVGKENTKKIKQTSKDINYMLEILS